MPPCDKVKPISRLSIEEPDDPNLTSCGLGSWRPAWLQVFANPIVFMVNLCIVNIFQLMVASVMFGTFSTLEKRFAFNSKISSMIMIADCIFSTLLSPLLGYYAVRYNRSRIIAWGSIILAGASILSAFPYFIYGPGTHLLGDRSFASSLNVSAAHNFDLCSSRESECTAEKSSSSNTVWPAVIMLFLGNFIRGIGFTTYWTIAMPFIDDNVPKTSSPLYLSIMHGVNLVGRLLGYFFCAYCLSFYEDPWNDPGLDPKDPRFIGAWWMGFFVLGIAIIFSTIPLFFYPMEFKTANVKTKEIQKQLEQKGASFMESLMRLVRNPLVILYFLGNEFRYFGMDGFYSFMAKYLESQYRQSSSRASAITGATGFAPVSIGLILGGLYISWYKPKARNLLIFVFLAEFVSFFTIGSGLFLGCDPINLHGSELQDSTFSLGSTCNRDCGCTTRVFSPICGSDGKTTYFSPCHAGCTESLNGTFQNCSCFSGPATSGYCASDMTCNSPLSIYLLLLTIGTLISATAKTGNSLITFRSVDPMDKTFTNGMLSSLVSILAFIPCELFYGHIVDSACLVWENKCGREGNCWFYSQNMFRNLYVGVTTVFLGLGSLFDFLIIFYSDQMKNLYDDENEDEKKVQPIEN